MSFQLPFGVRVLNPVPVENKYFSTGGTPYTSTSQVNAQVPVGIRHKGLTVNVNNVEYWYETGTTNGSLVTKSPSIANAGGVTGATNGLTKTGAKVKLGGTLTGATTIGLGTSSLTFTGTTGTLKYGSDLSSQYTNRSLVDKAYVTGLTTSSGVQTANNGLTKSGTNVRLGGTLTGSTRIEIGNENLSINSSGTTGTLYLQPKTLIVSSNNFNIDIDTSNTNSFTFNQSNVAGDFFGIGAGSGSYIHPTTASAFEMLSVSAGFTGNYYPNLAFAGASSKFGIATNNNLGANAYKFYLESLTDTNDIGKMQFVDNRIVTKGIEYFGNYSTGFGVRSLVDKGYVTGLTNTLLTKTSFNSYTGTTITSANNGLTKSGTNVRLGGNLTGATTIGLGTSSLIFTGTTGTLRYGSDLSAQYNIRSLVDKGYVTGLTSLNSKSSFSITGNSSTTLFAVTHNKNSRDVIVQVYESASPYGTILVDVERVSVNAVNVVFNTAPATSVVYRVVII